MSKGGQKQTVNTTTAPDAGTQAHINQMRQMAQQGANIALQGPGGGMNFGMGPVGGGPFGAARQAAVNGVQAQMPNDPNAQNGGGWFTGPLQQTPGEMAAPFMNPYLQNVIGGLRGEFDHLRGQASNATAQQATQAGAFGGSRAAVLEGSRLGELDRAQTSQIGGLLNSGFQNAMGQGLGFAQYQQGLQQQKQMEPLWRQQQAQQMMNNGMGPVGQQSNQVQQGPGRSALGSAAGGALTGASIGSIIPGIGTGIGAAVGGGLGLLGVL